jgi:hypothetical protein
MRIGSCRRLAFYIGPIPTTPASTLPKASCSAVIVLGIGPVIKHRFFISTWEGATPPRG